MARAPHRTRGYRCDGEAFRAASVIAMATPFPPPFDPGSLFLSTSRRRSNLAAILASMHPEIRSRSRMHLDHMHTPASAVRIPAEHGGYVKTQLPACFEHRNSKREPRRGDESGWCLSSSSVESRVPLEFSQTSARPDLYHRATLAWPQHQQQTRCRKQIAPSILTRLPGAFPLFLFNRRPPTAT